MLIIGGWGAWAALFMAGGTSWLIGAVIEPGRISSFFTVLIGAAVFVFGQYLHDNDTMTVIDPTDGQPSLVRNKHHIFWVPVRWWGLTISILGVLGVITG